MVASKIYIKKLALRLFWNDGLKDAHKKSTLEIVLNIPKLVKHTPNDNLRDAIEKPTIEIVENKPFELMK